MLSNSPPSRKDVGLTINNPAQCDARLPACQNCHKSGLSCSFYDDILQEDIPRSYIKSLYDRIEELKAVVSVHQSRSRSNGITTEVSIDPASQAQFILPSRNGYLFLERSPPAIIGNATIRKLLEQGIKIDSPFLIPGNLNPEEEGMNAHISSKSDRSLISPSTSRILLAHYTRYIEPVFPAAVDLADETEVSLRNMQEIDRCRVLLACAIAAMHKSYYVPAWKIVATTCREWAGELAAELVTKRDDQTVVILLLLLIYELADPERGLIWELLSFAAKTCLELGWHRTDEQDTQQFTGRDMPLDTERGRLSTENKKRTLSVLVHIERQDYRPYIPSKPL